MTLRPRLPRFSSKWLLVPPVLVGVAVLAAAVRNRQAPERRELAETPRALRVAAVRREHVTPTVIGHGVAKPARTWRAVAEVDGRVVETHPRLDPGEIVEQGEMLVRIDPTDYQLRLNRLEAQSASLAAQIGELQATRASDEALLAIEKEALEIRRRDVDRHRTLLDRNAVARAAFDAAQREHLAQQRQVQSLTNSLNVLPSKIARLEAEQKAIEQQMAEARRDLERTAIVAPFRCRLSSVEIEPGQYVAPGETLFEVHGLDASEVEAQVALDDLQLLAPTEPSSEAERPSDLLRGLQAVVTVRSGQWSRQWPAELVRIREQVQLATRTLGVVVRVERPYSAEEPSSPPLLEGLFCEVELRGKPRPKQLVVPRAAVRGGRLYVVNRDDRLEARSLSSVLPLRDLAVVTGDVEAGERVVLSDPTPAVEGTLVDPRSADSELAPRMALSP